jgi:hypothetical protein
MAIGNGSGHDIDYDVQPSDPGGGPSGGNAVAKSAGFGLFFSSLGTALAGIGCLTGLGGRGLLLAGFGSLVAGLVYHGITLDRARRLASSPAMPRLGIAPTMNHLADGQEHAHEFVPGTWVNFWHPDTKEKLAQSPTIFNSNARVTLRRYDPATTVQGPSGYCVEVT